MACVKLIDINKIYDKGVHAVHDFNLEIKDEEFVVFVGPSGCGKTTTLRMIAGLEDITSGELFIDDVLANNILPKNRDIAMVFQDYALYPHMTVYQNMAFGLKMRKVPKDEIKERIQQAADILNIEELLDRKPDQLSGGQRQRVALGRAIVKKAKVFLMDEPLSNLDAKLRVQMRTEIINLYERLKTTVIYVTHDQTEAMTMATRIVVMKDGYIQQIDSPMEVYLHPKNKFVASFIGSPSMNFANAVYNGHALVIDGFEVSVPEVMKKALIHHINQEVIFGVRPEDIFIDEDGLIKGETKVIELLGADQIAHITIGNLDFQAKITTKTKLQNHQTLTFKFNMEAAHIFDSKTEETIY